MKYTTIKISEEAYNVLTYFKRDKKMKRDEFLDFAIQFAKNKEKDYIDFAVDRRIENAKRLKSS